MKLIPLALFLAGSAIVQSSGVDAQDHTTRHSKLNDVAFESGTFGSALGDLKFLLEYNGSDLSMVSAAGAFQYSKQPDGSFRYQNFNIRLVSNRAIQVWADGRAPTDYIRTGTAKDWADAATAYNLGQIERMKFRLAQIEAQRAREAAMEEAENGASPQEEGTMFNALDAINEISRTVTAGNRGGGSGRTSNPSARSSTSVSSNAPVRAPQPVVGTTGRSASPSAPEMCTTPGGTRTWSTGMLTLIEDARREYEEEARNAQSRGGSIGPMQCGQGVTFGAKAAVCTATITYPAKTGPCGSRVSAQ